jgi:ADP-ribose pyrophosphatase YjhB (NUDIX family)
MMRNRGAHNPQQSRSDLKGAAFQDLFGASRPMTSYVVFQRNALLFLSLILAVSLFLSTRSSSACHLKSSASSNLRNDMDQCELSFGSYRGPQYRSEKSGTIGKPKCLLESKWIKVSQHTVKFPGSDTVFDDWMWIDYHDRINVLVEDEAKEGEERRFLVFEQTKYALEGRSSLAIIGGVIEPGEDPEKAARREVDEEMNGLQCENFHFLGRYRTDVNRGMGWLNGFLATKCSRDLNRSKHQALVDEVGAADTERQDLRSITLTELRESARKGEFLEVQWTATVASALLHPELIE